MIFFFLWLWVHFICTYVLFRDELNGRMAIVAVFLEMFSYASIYTACTRANEQSAIYSIWREWQRMQCLEDVKSMNMVVKIWNSLSQANVIHNVGFCFQVNSQFCFFNIYSYILENWNVALFVYIMLDGNRLSKCNRWGENLFLQPIWFWGFRYFSLDCSNARDD